MAGLRDDYLNFLSLKILKKNTFQGVIACDEFKAIKRLKNGGKYICNLSIRKKPG